MAAHLLCPLTNLRWAHHKGEQQRHKVRYAVFGFPKLLLFFSKQKAQLALWSNCIHVTGCIGSVPQMPQMPWICGDTTMLEQIERKRTLCVEIRSRQHPHLQRSPLDRNEDRHQGRNHCKQESASVLPGWGKSSGAKKIRPPPYPTQKTVFWDTAI